MKYLKYFKTEAEYNAFIQSENFILPNVSYAVDTDSVFYNIVKTETGDYKIFVLEKNNISGLTYNMVDLGLPSGLLWSDRNVGASSPEDFGTNFAWGETSGYNTLIKYCTSTELCTYLQPLVDDEIELTPDNIDEVLSTMGVSEKDMTTLGVGFGKDKCFSVDWSDYFDTTDGGSTFNKYAIDKLTVLQSEDDAATVNMGAEYRMPTKENFKELEDNCTIAYIDLQGNEFSWEEVINNAIAENNFKGVKFTGSNGNNIFIPASGDAGNSSLVNIYYYCTLLSSSLDPTNSKDAYCFVFNCRGDQVTGINFTNRFIGNTVRGVK